MAKPVAVDPKPECPHCKSSENVEFVTALKFWACISHECQNRLIGYEGGCLVAPKTEEPLSLTSF